MWSGLNLDLCLIVQMMAIQGNGTHCLSLTLVSSQLVHTHIPYLDQGLGGVGMSTTDNSVGMGI